jgi:hypothetical protein
MSSTGISKGLICDSGTWLSHECGWIPMRKNGNEWEVSGWLLNFSSGGGRVSLSWFLIQCLNSLGYAREKLWYLAQGDTQDVGTVVPVVGQQSFLSLLRSILALSDLVLWLLPMTKECTGVPEDRLLRNTACPFGSYCYYCMHQWLSFLHQGQCRSDRQCRCSGWPIVST